MITLILSIPFLFLFMAINVVAGCYLAIRLGYGPPNWQTALNLVVRLTTLQDHLNEGRAWIDNKAPWADQFLNRLRVPKPLIFIVPVDEAENGDGEHDEQLDELAAIPIAELLTEQLPEPLEPDVEPVFYDDALATAITNCSTETWFVNNKNAETSLLRLNAVSMRSGRFAAALEGRIRSLLGNVSQTSMKEYIEDIKDDCQHYLVSLTDIAGQVRQRGEEFGEFKTLAGEIVRVDTEHKAKVEAMLKSFDDIANSPPEEEARRLLHELSDLRKARHQLRDMRERVFTLVTAKEQRFDTIPKQLFVDDLSGERGRIGLMATLCDWWNNGRQKGRYLTFVLVDFVKFGEVNDNHGALIGDSIIKHFVGMLKGQFDAGDLFGVYSGNAFLIVTIHAGLQKTITNAEHLRQKQMKTVYKAKGSDQPIQVLLTGAVVETTGEQSIEEIFTTLDNTMAAAKLAGRNHTFCWNAGAAQPEKIEPPEFEEEAQEIVLEETRSGSKAFAGK